MKNQLFAATLIILSASALKADYFYEVFNKPYRQHVGLAVTGTMIGGGLYKTARAIGARRPAGALLSVGLVGAGAFGALIVEGNSPEPKVLGPVLRKYEQTFPIKTSIETPSLKGAILTPIKIATAGLFFGFGDAMNTAGAGFNKAKLSMNRFKSYFRSQK